MRLFLIAAALWAAAPVSAATLKEAAGLVQIRRAGEDTWRPARAGILVNEGDALRTGFNARALVVTAQGTKVTAAGNAHVVLEDDRAAKFLAYLLFGSVRVDAAIAGGRQASLRTPVATLRARSDRAAFTAAVAGGGKTVADVLDGLVGAEDNRGASTLLKSGQRLEADMRGLREAAASPTPARARKEDFAALMRRELGFDLARDASLERAASETRRAEHELGRLLTDASGNRVRVESWVTRPTAASVKLVTVNQRPGQLHAFAWTGAFDRSLPVDLEPVLSSLAGSYDAASPFTLLEYQALFTNGPDRLLERADGGHQVDLNANADPLDDVAGGRPFFYTLFDRSGLYVNGAYKRGWTGANIQSQREAVAATTNDPFTGAALPSVITGQENYTKPEPGRAFHARHEEFSDGTLLDRNERWVEADGGTAVSPAGPHTNELDFSIKASEWAGRGIEIIGSGRILTLTRQLP
jgi:hypothetical protein